MKLTKEQQIENLKDENKVYKKSELFLPYCLLRYAIDKGFDYKKLDSFAKERTSEKKYGRPDATYSSRVTYLDENKKPLMSYVVDINGRIKKIEGYKDYPLRGFLV